MRFLKLKLFVAVCAVAGFLGSAQAADINTIYGLQDTGASPASIHLVVGTADANLTAGETGYIQNFWAASPDRYNDFYTFTALTPTILNVSASSNQLGTLAGYLLDPFTFGLYSGSTPGSGTSVVSPTAILNPDGTYTYLFDHVILTAGDYYFQVSGNTAGQYGGGYQLNYSAVPEPNVIALMVVGLAVVGFSLRGRVRRTDQKFS